MSDKRIMGRPTLYSPALVGKVDEYLSTTGKEQMHLPKIVSFARYINVSKDTLYEWAKHNKDFSDALEKIMKAQEEQLIDDGIYGGKEINASIVKLLLMSNHGMRENTDTNLNVKSLTNLVQVNESDKPKSLADGGKEGQTQIQGN